MSTRICRACGKEFESDVWAAYCSPTCLATSEKPLHGRYTRRYVPDHPLADQDGRVMESKYQYLLAHPETPLTLLSSREFVIYHINGLKSDNRPRNLALVRTKVARKLNQSFAGSVARPVFDLYGITAREALEQDLLHFDKGVYMLSDGSRWPTILLNVSP